MESIVGLRKYRTSTNFYRSLNSVEEAYMGKQEKGTKPDSQ